MTPKEKAKKLVEKMWIYTLPNSDGSLFYDELEGWSVLNGL